MLGIPFYNVIGNHERLSLKITIKDRRIDGERQY